MKFRELKDKLNSMTDAQLDWPVVIFEGDSEYGSEIDSIDESGDDIYWLDGECYGMIDGVQDAMKDDADLKLEDFTIIPKGTVTLHYELSELEKN